MKPETYFRQQYVLPFLRTLRSTKFFSIQQQALAGHPDIIACVRGKFVALELKAREGILSRLQEHNLNEIRRCHGEAFVVSPDTWLKMKEILRAMDEGKKWK